MSLQFVSVARLLVTMATQWAACDFLLLHLELNLTSVEVGLIFSTLIYRLKLGELIPATRTS